MKDYRLTYCIQDCYGLGFIGIAWNYEEHVLVSTITCKTYTEARAELEQVVNKHAKGYRLFWFDGEKVLRSGAS
jgi:hypothetical protein